MKTEVEVRKVIDVPAERAWAVIRTGKDVDLWFSAITSCRRDGHQRVCTMAGGGELSETITLTKDDQRLFGYRVDRHPLPVGPVEATMQVVDTGEGRSEIVWRARFEGGDAEVAQVAGMLEGLYAQGIDSLAAYTRKLAA